MRSKIVLEIGAYSVEWAVAAQAAGADRVELCGDPLEGGITPSYGTIAAAREKLEIGLHVIIRPRGGDFLYSEAEVEVMRRDIEACQKLGVDGVVMGILLADGTVDKRRCRELLEIARPMSVTFHRAFDMTVDAHQALEDIIEIQCARALTSGQASSALEGVNLIAELVRRAGDRMIVMPGGGVRDDNLPDLIRLTGAREFHASARKTAASKMTFRKMHLTMGSSAGSEYELQVADPQRIQRMREIADKLWVGGA